MIILGIETSCDETSAAIIQAQNNDKKVTLLSNVVASSLQIHAKTGGIIPENAAREQVKYIIPVIEKALSKLKVENGKLKINSQLSTLNPQFTPPIDAIAVTVGPGLIGSLLVGVETAKTLSYVWKKPIIPVNHLIGHIYANFIKTQISSILSLRAKRGNPINNEIASSYSPRNDKITFPALALIVSGGHTDLVLIKNHGNIKWLGGTRDDAAGEAFDKIGRLLNLTYPGGPAIEKEAKLGDPKSYPFPRPMIYSKDFDFSFSGLKAAVFREIKTIKQFSNVTISDLSASVQEAIIDVLVSKTLRAAQEYKVKSILLGGGVASNQKLRDQFALEIRNLPASPRGEKLEITLSVPPKSLCTDNGAMIASAAFFNYKEIPWPKITANPELYFE